MATHEDMVQLASELLSNHSTVLVAAQREKVRQLVSYLLANDFNGLINLLYRLDVSEQRIKHYTEQRFLTDEVLVEFIMERLTLRALAYEQFSERFSGRQNDDGQVERW